ncbi:MAG: hypothetical protein M3H12_01185 [Chromatiales bacterium]
MTNATFFLNVITQHPIGCPDTRLPDYLRLNKAIIGLQKDEHGVPYTDNLCFFRCLALHRGAVVTALKVR